MTKQDIEVMDFEDKKAANGKRYSRFKTAQGWFSVFDKETIDQLKASEGKIVSVEITQENGFSNIKRFYGVSGMKGDQDTGRALNPSTAPDDRVKEYENPVFWVSYAKDLFVLLHPSFQASLNPKPENVETAQLLEEQLMRQCCNLLKIARDEFINGRTNDNQQE